ncbi:glutamine-synthetase adenylyltransferase [Bryobacter aggregatus]|uniref:[protein-PII] uridylyltransferase family protein n=1 Tax=Bryobacter aggregatus TaxID=360054 RepID=UPI000689A3A2|nr:glutamine-synthetase adenylyltransferase [Bryobacter aggregatus]
MSDLILNSLEGILKNHSRVLAEELRQHPEWLEGLQLERDFAVDRFRELLAEIPFQNLALAAFRRRCILRILLRDILGHASLSQTVSEISALADAILDWSYQQIRHEAEAVYGTPRLEDGTRCGCSILALGKLGGQELNYSSDIDLMYVYDGVGETSGPMVLSNKEFFEKVAQRQTQFLGAYTAEGICYRVDLRLRPEGSLGEIAVSLEAAREYYRVRARDWELQMMIKARVSAGDPAPGLALIEFVEPLTYRTTTDFSAIEAVSASRVRLDEKLSTRKLSGDALDIKLTGGGIRDIEFLVQCLQRLHGGREPWLRHGGTMLALARLNDKSLISNAEFLELSEAYEFLRHLEHRLQVMEDRQTHSMPENPEEIDHLARRMPPIDLGHENTGPRLVARLKRHLAAVESIYAKFIYGRAAAWAPSQPDRSPLNAGSKLDRLLDAAKHDAALTRDLLDIAALSPYLTEELVRQPLWVEEVRRMRVSANHPVQWEAEGGMRRAFRRRNFRIQCESLCLRRPVFETLSATSDLADAVIAQAYRLALNDVSKGRTQIDRDMMVVALGRLGMREFDLASDADLVFILPNDAAEDLEFWTRVAARMIELLTAYTGDGVIFTVDARLRPYGREGDLVQFEETYIDYFTQHAEAWEGIAYMKARAVAGNVERATAFLSELQQVDWRRYGQSHRSRRQLSDMRVRLEKEQGKSNALKAGHGGYYDIDFILMYLRLRGAGIFFKVLNTPERIDVLEKMGHLERDDARFLMDAATLFRAIDHGLRLYTGQPAGNLPHSRATLDALHAMLERWVPDRLRRESFEADLRSIQDQTRETFDRLFA